MSDSPDASSSPQQQPPYSQPPQPQPYPPQQPQYSQPPYGQPVAPPYPMKPPTGALSWALGFIALVPLPFLSAVAAGVAMAIAYSSAARRGGLARENARTAANWGLTFLVCTIVLVGLHFVLLAVLTGDGSTISGFYPFGTVITIWFAISVLHVVLTIVGTVRASQGKRMRVPFAIPFIRA